MPIVAGRRISGALKHLFSTLAAEHHSAMYEGVFDGYVRWPDSHANNRIVGASLADSGQWEKRKIAVHLSKAACLEM